VAVLLSECCEDPEYIEEENWSEEALRDVEGIK
jgi:hypothetical protein